MEKVKITVEQEKALEVYRNKADRSFKGVISDFHLFVTRRNSFEDDFLLLDNFTPEQFALLLCGWYEVEQQPIKFEVGDWAYDEKDDEYLPITKIKSGGHLNSGEIHIGRDYVKRNIKKVTEPWKIMLLELGRKKPEFHKDDIIVTESEVYEAEYLSDEEIIVLFEKDLVRAFHAAEHRIEVKGHDS